MIDRYEFSELFEAGDAADLIQGKPAPFLDEVSGTNGPIEPGLNESE